MRGALGTPRNLPRCSTSKTALSMLVKELAKTLGRLDIRINALVPGAVATGGFVADSSLVRHIPLGRLGRAEDLAPVALALLSDRKRAAGRDVKSLLDQRKTTIPPIPAAVFNVNERGDFAHLLDPIASGAKRTTDGGCQGALLLVAEHNGYPSSPISA